MHTICDEMLLVKRTFYKCMAKGGSPKERPHNAKYVEFRGSFSMHFHFPSLHILSCPLFSPIFAIPLNSALPFPKVVNKKLIYRRQNALSIKRTHERNTFC